MFHHFHDGGIHKSGQGSISKEDFYKIINFIGRKNILDADIFFDKLKNNKLEEKEVCITFDDGIKCQIDIALPVLEELKIKSFFFVYSSIFENRPDYLEVFRYFRMNYFDNVDIFYNDFYRFIDVDLTSFFEDQSDLIKLKKIRHSLYSIEDIKFRLVRDIFLSKDKYEEIMFAMMKEKKCDYKGIISNIYFKKDDIINLDSLGHLVGLHSHNHPTLVENLNYDEQKDEYVKCQSVISKILNKPANEIKWMSHPCGSYNKDTLAILNELGIKLGFKQYMNIDQEKGMKKINNTNLEIARINHNLILKMMN
jgi:peptidoglycan/xylan/chitin deacetylase (PgdA/CDA1 family)